MATKAEQRMTPLKALSIAFVILWVIIAAFPFLWTAWGSFKVQGDFFSKADWTNALTGTRTIIETGGAFTMNGYEGAWIQEDFWRAVLNTCIVVFHRHDLADLWHARWLCTGTLGLQVRLLDIDGCARLPRHATHHARLWLPLAVL